ncbi:hypothetical protein D3872_19910 [Massilia cavernae]|uniref:Uncharacterized protein n=2 Tax=Massilia cavernae TaxID=2320864 RepID=A0A418XG08_9BURK|nr:hypothetical protein D3872_19910 [Massilia cavernae]
MFLLVALTGGAGFFASFVMLRTGIVEMWIRYLLSFGVAYVVFLFLLWLWLRTKANDYIDVIDVSGLPTWSHDAPTPVYSGKGGTFDGDGASGSYELASDATLRSAEPAGITDNALGSVADADEFAIPLGVILVLAAILFSSLFMVYSAPLLFAELAVDGLLSASLYRRLRGLETRHWLETALRKTALPFAMTAIAISAAGWTMAHNAPGTHSVGEFLTERSQ